MRLLLFAWILIASSSFADDWDPEGKIDSRTTFVSLGSHCEIAVYLNENHLRKAAFPFDWLLTCNHDRFLSLLEQDFALFVDERYLIQHPIRKYVIENCHYAIEFRHDWPFLDLACDEMRYRHQLQEMQAKYDRRINRFRDLRNYRGKVFFIRVAYDLQNDANLYWGIHDIEQITAEKARAIKQVLDRYFPNLNFTLVIVNYLQNNVPAISLVDNVLEFKIDKYNKGEEYARLFDVILKMEK